MAQAQIDEYLARIDPIKRETLELMRSRILELIPEAEQEMHYAMPAFVIDGKALAGFAAFKNHLSWIPFSGQVVSKHLDDIAPHSLGSSSGVFKFAVDRPLPKDLIRKLILTRALEALGDHHALVARLR